MVKVLIGVLCLLLVLALIPVVVIACSAPSSPLPMASMAGPLSRVSFDDVPAPRELRARDGTPLRYYAYRAAPAKVAVLIHGSAGPGTSMHALAKALRDTGVSAYVLDIRGHGGSGRRGDIDYIGQIDDDLADFVANLGPAKSGEVRACRLVRRRRLCHPFCRRTLQRTVRSLRVPVADPAGSADVATER